MNRFLSRAGWVPLLVWAQLAATSRVAANDVWLQLRVGADVLRDLAVPHLDPYSATLSDQLFVAHEWLSSVAFALVYKHAGGFPGLSVLGGLGGLGCGLLLLAAIPPGLRGARNAAGAWAGAMALVLTRMLVRPHLFSLLLDCAFVVGLERFRATNRLRFLVWLPLLQVLWANVHGGAVLGPALLGAVALGLALEKSPQARPVGATALACAAACLLNPYGFRLITFALHFGASRDAAKLQVFEWFSPFSQLEWASWTSLWMLALALLAFGLWRRRGDRPWADALQAGLGVGLSLSAIRFAPEVGIFGLPVLARCWLRPTPPAAVAPRAVAGALLVALALTVGFPFSSREVRHVGVGLGGNPPLAEVEAIRRLRLRGVVLNEFEDGTALAALLAPIVKPVVDSRVDLYGEGRLLECEAALDSPARFAAYASRHGVTLVLLWRGRHETLEAALEQDPGWSRVFDGPDRVLYAVTRGAP